jgi:hypothetical protein
MMGTETKDALKLWKSMMMRGVYYLLVRKLTLGVVRARALSF